MLYVLKNSFTKLFRSPGIYVGVTIFLIATLLIEVIFSLTGHWQKQFGNNLYLAFSAFDPGGDGTAILIPILGASIFFIIPLFVCLLIIRLFSTDIQNGDMQLAVSKKVSRLEIFWAKTMSILILSVLADIFVFLFTSAIMCGVVGKNLGTALLLFNLKFILIAFLITFMSLGFSTILSLFISGRYIIIVNGILGAIALILVFIASQIYEKIDQYDNYTASYNLKSQNKANQNDKDTRQRSFSINPLLENINAQHYIADSFQSRFHESLQSLVINTIDKNITSFNNFAKPYIITQGKYDYNSFLNKCIYGIGLGPYQGRCDLSNYKFTNHSSKIPNRGKIDDQVLSFFNGEGNVPLALIGIYNANQNEEMTSNAGRENSEYKRTLNDIIMDQQKGYDIKIDPITQFAQSQMNWFNYKLLTFDSESYSHIKSYQTNLKLYYALDYPVQFKMLNYFLSGQESNYYLSPFVDAGGAMSTYYRYPIGHNINVTLRPLKFQSVQVREKGKMVTKYILTDKLDSSKFYYGIPVIVIYAIIPLIMLGAAFIAFKKKNFA